MRVIEVKKREKNVYNMNNREQGRRERKRNR